MKKTFSISCCLVLALISGCQTQEKEINKTDNKEVEKNTEVAKETEEVEPTLEEELLQNNRSSIAGEYVNPAGEIITINEDGTLYFHNSDGTSVSNQIATPITYNERYKSYEWGIHYGENAGGAFGVAIFPPGIDVECPVPTEDGSYKTITVSTNNNKIRMTSGQQAATEDQIFTKK